VVAHNDEANDLQVEGSIYLFGLIAPSHQNLLMTLQSNLAELVHAPGNVPFAKYRAFKNQVREADEPYRFVDGDLVERFLDISDDLQSKAVEGLGMDVEAVRGMVEVLRRLH
jgi:DNA damage-binding protein 1